MSIIYYLLTILYFGFGLFIFRTISKIQERSKRDHQSLTTEQKQQFSMFTRKYFDQNKLRLLIGSLFLAPFRIFAVFILAISVYLLLKISKQFNGMKKIKFIIVKYMISFFVRLIMLTIGYIRIKKTRINLGKNRQIQAPIIISNHRQFVDHFLLMHQFGSAFIAKQLVSTYPIVGTVAQEMQSLFVNRTDRSQKNQVLDNISFRVNNFDPQTQNPLAVYPEGTTSNGDQILKFKKGAFFSFTPIQIIYLDYKNYHIDNYLDSYGTLYNILNVCSQITNEVEIMIFDVVTPEDFNITDKSEDNWTEYAKKIEELITKHTKKEFVEAGYKESCEFQDLVMDIWKKEGYNDKKHN